MIPAFLALNSGSSSLKYGVYELGSEERRIMAGTIETTDHAAAIEETFIALGSIAIAGVGHRIVHGGAEETGPVLVDDALVARLEGVTELAPLHVPPALAVLAAARSRHPDLPHVACFDTAFHATLPEVARRLPIPDRFVARGARRYGFHGLSFESVVATLAPLPARVIVAHLGSGSSLVALRDGRSVDTTMGLTPTGGILMGTRSGDLDPGVLLWLLRQVSAEELAHIVEKESGLLAIGGTADVRALVERDDPRAARALDAFSYGVKKAIGSFIAVLGGLDMLVFTGGIGEHSPEVRVRSCAGLEGLGVVLDPGRNDRSEGVVSAARSAVMVRVVKTHENLVIARQTRDVVTSLSR